MVVKTDFLRYALIWKYGGVYSDADTTCLRGIDGWFEGLESKHDRTKVDLIVGVE
ncbi:UNVERIFIED_CONTAM: hypothetical protein HDU68_003242, partial [Siphonaria sp. JEL0065]